MGIRGMNKKLLFSIIAVAFVGSLFTVAYAGSAFTTITLAGTVDMVSNQIKNLQDPTDPQDAVTKSYVDNLFACEGGSEMCTLGIGECENDGINICIDGVAQCGGTPGTPVTEICDSLDNDCDGNTDEDFPSVGDSCSVGVGICNRSGNIICSQDLTGVECDAVPGIPQTEVCNSLDDDCNGLVDDNCQSCDPLNPEPVCGPNMTCFPQQLGGPLCVLAGTGFPGEACTNTLDCSPGLGCIGSQCLEFCAVSNPICLIPGTSCVSLNLFIGTEEYGACI